MIVLGMDVRADLGPFNDCADFRIDGDGNAVLEMSGEVAFEPRVQGLVGGANAKEQKFPGSQVNKNLSLKGRGAGGETVEVLVFHELPQQSKGQVRIYSALVRATLPPKQQEALGLNRFKGICIQHLNFFGLNVDSEGNLRGSLNLFPRGIGPGVLYVLKKESGVDRMMETAMQEPAQVLAALTRPGECSPGEVVCAHDTPEKHPGSEARMMHAVGAEPSPRVVTERAE